MASHEYNPAVASSIINALMSENTILRNHVCELNRVIFNLTEELNRGYEEPFQHASMLSCPDE